MACKILYITFIDIDGPAYSGSSKRPKKMLEAFQEMGLEIKLLDGWGNKYFERRRNVRKILNWLKTNTPDICYVEPPSGPFLCPWDLKLLKALHKKKIPIGLFYRDFYWMYPEIMELNKNLKDVLKLRVIQYMQKRDLKVFRKTCKCIFFASVSAAKIIEQGDVWHILPPGCEKKNVSVFYENDCDRIVTTKQLTYLYVGGANRRYGTELLLKSFENINKSEVFAKLIFVCRKEEWDKYYVAKIYKSAEWLEVLHVEGEDLEKLYRKSDICIAPFLKDVYSDMAAPIKLFEYISYAKPIIVTHCEEIMNFVNDNHIGWVIKDREEDLEKIIVELNEKRQEVIERKSNCLQIIQMNTWLKRAKNVVESLLG